jgi:hypothetical protein
VSSPDTIETCGLAVLLGDINPFEIYPEFWAKGKGAFECFHLFFFFFFFL